MYLNEMEKRRAKSIAFTIQDCLNSIEIELNEAGKPYKGYLLEKLKPIKNDIDCLIYMCEKEK